MKTMKRLLALLLALSMVMPNCLTIASAYSEELVEELVEETAETTEAVVEEVFEEIIEEEVEEYQSSDDLASEELRDVTVTCEEYHYVPELEMPSDEELFRGYVNSVLNPEASISLLSDMGMHSLPYGGNAYQAYCALFNSVAYDTPRGPLVDIAEGRREDAMVAVGYGPEADAYALFETPFNGEDLKLLLDALMVDLPFHLYWFDKTEGVRILVYTYRFADGSEAYLVEFYFSVSHDYANKDVVTKYYGYLDMYCTTDLEKTRAAYNVAQYAHEVAGNYEVEDNTMSWDYQVLEDYFWWIWENVTYNQEAADDNNYFSTVDTDPWQLIYVFDQNPDTNVVCEGYAKAFEYLCDLGALRSEDTICYSVTGDLYQYGEKLGHHMWNLVVLDGETYLVDVTNDVFMECATKVENVYRLETTGSAEVLRQSVYSNGLSYEYDVETTHLFGNEILALSTEPYDPTIRDPETDYVEYDEATLQQALYDAVNSGDNTVYLNNDVSVYAQTFEIPNGVRLCIADGVNLVNGGGVWSVYGSMEISGYLINHGFINLCGDAAQLQTENDGCIDNYMEISVQTETARITVNNGNYFANEYEADGKRYSASVSVRYFGDDTLDRVTGIAQGAQKLYYNGNDASVLNALAAWAGQGMGDYAAYHVNVDGTMTIGEETRIYENGSLAFAPGGSLVVNALLKNYGILHVRSGASVTVGNYGQVYSYGTFNALSGSTVTNNGVISKSADLEDNTMGTMWIGGTYTGKGTLYTEANSAGQWNGIDGVDDSKVVLSVSIDSDYTDEEALATLKAAKDAGFRSAVIYLEGERTFDEHLALVTPVTLHIEGTLNQNAPITLEKGSALHVSHEGVLNMNNNENADNSLIVLSGAQVVVNGILNSNVPLHLGYDDSAAMLYVNGTLNNNAYLNIGKNAKMVVSPGGTLNQNWYDESTGLGGVIIENNGTIVVSYGGNFEAGYDVVNKGTFELNGTMLNRGYFRSEPGSTMIVNYNGELTNASGMDLNGETTIRGKLNNWAGIYMSVNDAVLTTEGNGKLTNNAVMEISVENAQLNFHVGGYVQGEMSWEDMNGNLTSNPGTLSLMYFSGNSHATVTNVANSQIGLWFNGTELSRYKSMVDYVKAQGYWNYGWNVTGDVTVNENLTVDENGHLNITYGNVMTVNGNLTNNGTLRTYPYVDFGYEVMETSMLMLGNGNVLTNNGTVNNEGDVVLTDPDCLVDNGIWNGNDPVFNSEPDVPVMPDVPTSGYTEQSLQEMLNSGISNLYLDQDLTITGTDFTVPKGTTLEIADGRTLMVAFGASLINNGDIMTNNGTIYIVGTMTNNDYLTLTPLGTTGQLFVTGTLINNDRLQLLNGTAACYGVCTNNGEIRADIKTLVVGFTANKIQAAVRTELELINAATYMGTLTGYSDRPIHVADDITLSQSLTIPQGVTLNVGYMHYGNRPYPQYGLTIPSGVTLINNGFISIAEHTYLHIYGTLENNGNAFVSGEYINEGLVTGNRVDVYNPGGPSIPVIEPVNNQDELEAKLNEAMENLESYDFHGDVTLERDLTIAYNDWEQNIYVPVYVYGDLTVPSGKTLTIDGDVYIVGGSITVQPGGKLVVTETGYPDLLEGELRVDGTLELAQYRYICVKPQNDITITGVPYEKQYADFDVDTWEELVTAAANLNGYGLVLINPMRNITMGSSLELPANVDMGVIDTEFVIPSGMTLTVNSSVNVSNQATMVVNGTLVIKPDAWLTVFGKVINNGAIVNNGNAQVLDNGTITGDGSWQGNAPNDEVVPELPDVIISSQAELNALLAEANGNTYCAEQNITITGRVTLTKSLIMNGTTLTVENGGMLTVPEDFDLGAQAYGKILVKDGGKLENNGCVTVYASELTVENASTGYAQGENAQLNRFYSYGNLSTVNGIPNHLISVGAMVADVEQIEEVNALVRNAGYKEAGIYIDAPLNVAKPETEPEGPPYEVHVIPEAQWYIYNDITVDESAFLIIDQGAALNLNGNKITVDGQIFNYGNLEMGGGEITVTAGDYHCLTNAGNLNADGAILNIYGAFYSNTPLYLHNNAVLNVDGILENYGEITVGTNETSAQLNVSGIMNNYCYMKVWDAGEVNVSGILNNYSMGELPGIISSGGTFNVSGNFNIEGTRMEQYGTMLVTGNVNVRSWLWNIGRTVLESNGDGTGGRMNVMGGGSLDLVERGQFHVEAEAKLTNGDIDENGWYVEYSGGQVRIRMGTLYVMEGGHVEGPWDGTITWENGFGEGSTEDYLSYWWLNNGDEGWFAQIENGNENRNLRIHPGYNQCMVFYENIWIDDGDDHYWQRNRFVPEIDSEYLTVECIADWQNNSEFVEGEDGYGFVMIRAAKNGWNQSATINCGDLSMPVFVGRNLEHGYYSAPEATDENWLETIIVNNLADDPQDKKVYYMVTAEGVELTGNYELNCGLEGVSATYIGNNTFEITIPGSSIKNLLHWSFLEIRCETTEPGHWFGYGTDIKSALYDDLNFDAWMSINGVFVNYSAEYDFWVANGNNGPELWNMADVGLSYDYETNTLTMTDANLSGLLVGYYQYDENGNPTDQYRMDLPNENLTLNLVGSNSIISTTDVALHVDRGVKLNITGDGSLYVKTDNGENGIYNEWDNSWYSSPAVGIWGEGSELTISGNANVTVEIDGKGVWTDDEGNLQEGCVQAITGWERSLTVTDNAVLTTVVPEDAVVGNMMPDAEFSGGYMGIDGFRNITVSGNAQVYTQNLNIYDGSYTQTGGYVSITPLGHVAPHEKNGVSHTHMNGINAEVSTINVTGGTLRINIPDTDTESVWYRMIGLNGGSLNIGGGEIQLWSNRGGRSISLENGAVMNMTGGRVVFYGCVWDEGDNRNIRPMGIWTDDRSTVNIENGQIDAYDSYFEFNGITNWGTGEDDSWPTFYGERTYFGAGGKRFDINNGSIELMGKDYGENDFLYAVFDAYGEVNINGGNIDVIDGIIGVGGGTSLNGGTVSVSNLIQNTEGLYIQNYFAINGGELSVSVPGGTFKTQNGNIINIPAVWVDGTFHQMGGMVNISSDSTEAIHNYGSVLVNGGTMTLNGKIGLVSECGKDGWVFISQEDPNVPTVVRMLGEEAGLVAQSSVEILGGRVYATSYAAPNAEEGLYPAAVIIRPVYNEDGTLAMTPMRNEQGEIIGYYDDPLAHLVVAGGAKLYASSALDYNNDDAFSMGILAINAPVIIHEGEDGSTPEVVVHGEVAMRTRTTAEGDTGLESEYVFQNMSGDVLNMVQVYDDETGEYINTLMDGENPATDGRAVYKLTQEDLAEDLQEAKENGAEYVMSENFVLTGDLTVDTWFTIPNNVTLFVPEGTTLIIDTDVTEDFPFTISGRLEVEGELIVNGYLYNGGQVDNYGTVTGEGTIFNATTFHNYHEIDFDGDWEGYAPIPMGTSEEYTAESLQAALNNASAGDTVRLSHDLHLGTQILTIPENVTLDIADNAHLYVDGNFLRNNGTLSIHGTMELQRDLFNEGLILVKGQMLVQNSYLHQDNTMLISGEMSLTYSRMYNNGRTVLQTTENGGGCMNIQTEGMLDLIERGQFHVEEGARLVNDGDGFIRICMGTLYVMNGGYMDGPRDGIVTYQDGYGENGTDDYLSYRWLNNGPDGWYVNKNDRDYRTIRMWPGYNKCVVFYKNEWYAEGEDYYWKRTPVVPEIDCDYLALGYLTNNPNNSYLEGEPMMAMVEVRAANNMDALNTSGELRVGDLSMPVFIGRDMVKGYYSEPVASDAAWLESIMVNNLKEPVEDKVFFFIVTDSDVTMSENYILNTQLSDVNVEYLGDNVYEITIPADTIRNMEGNSHFDFRGETTQPGWYYGIGTNIQTIQPYNIRNDAWFEINGSSYNYSSEYDVWSVSSMNGSYFTTLPEGVSYDFESNTLTLTNANLSELEVGYYDWDGQNPNYDHTFLPNENLTLELVGENTIVKEYDSAMRIGRGVKMDITGDGRLYLKTDNKEGTWYEPEQRWISWAALDLCLPESELTISGNAEVTVEIDGGNYWSEFGVREKQHGSVLAISGNGEMRTLTVCDDAVLTTIVPENVLRWDEINGTGGYNGIGGFENIVISDNATVNTQYLGIGDGSYTQSGGTVNITAQPNLMMNEQRQWNEETQRDEVVGMVEHTHFDGIHTNGGNVNITGGELNITVPETAQTDSVWFRGIAMDSGELTISDDAVVTFDAPKNYNGNGIELSCAHDNNGPVANTKSIFHMTGGKLVMKEALFDNLDLARVIWTDGNAEVTIDGGEWDLDAVIAEFNGKTTWNGGTVNGEELIFIAGGESFVINDGEFNLTGKPLEGNDEVFSNALFRAAGMVKMNGGTINITDGVLGVPTAFELNDGEITVNNTDPAFAEVWGLVIPSVQGYMAVNGGQLNVSVIGAADGDASENNPAARILGGFHQMGGTVNITSENASAIKSYGSVLVNDGEMNLSGFFGIQQIRSEENPDGMIFVNGGKLNIEATNTGIFSVNSPVKFVQGENGENPSVSINTDACAISIRTDDAENTLVSDYSFINSQGERLYMQTRKEMDCYVHMLMNGLNIALEAQLKNTPSISQADFVAAMQAAMAEDEQVYHLNQDVTISSDLELPMAVKVVDGAELTVASGAVLTIREDKILTAENAAITVMAGGKIHNIDSRLINMGGVMNFGDDNAYVEEGENADMVMRSLNIDGGLRLGTTNGWPYADQTLEVVVDKLGVMRWAMSSGKAQGFGKINIEVYNSITVDSDLIIPENVTVIFNSPVLLSDGELNDSEISTLTVPENVSLTIAAAETEGAAHGALFINNGAVLDVLSGAVVNTYGNLHIGNWQSGAFDVSGTMNVAAGAQIELASYTAVHTDFESGIPGVMNVSGSLITSGEDTHGGTGGYLQNGGILNILEDGLFNSYFLFSADGETNIYGSMSNNHEMYVTGELNLYGSLENRGYIYVDSGEEAEKAATFTVEANGGLFNMYQMVVADNVVVKGYLDNQAGIFLTADDASFTTEGGKVWNDAMITTEGTISTIDFTNGEYVHGSQGIDGILYPAELIGDYRADGCAAVKLTDMSKATLRYVGDTFADAEAMIAEAEADGYGNYILGVDGDMQISIAGDETMVITPNSIVTVKPGSTLTVSSGTLVNQGTLYLGADKGVGANLVNDGWIVNEGKFQAVSGSYVNNNGTMENNVSAVMALNGTYEHNGRMLVIMNEQGQTGKLTGNITNDQMTLWAAISGSVQNPENFLRTLTSNASGYSSAEICLLTDVNITSDLEIPGNVSLVIGSGVAGALTVEEGVTVITGGNVRVENGSLTINGRYIPAGGLDTNNAIVTINENGSLVNGGYVTINENAKLINNGTIDNGDHDFRMYGTYVHGENAVAQTGYIDDGDTVSIGLMEGIHKSDITLFHPIRAVFPNHNEDSIRDMMQMVASEGYADGQIWIFDKNVSITEDMIVPENVTIRLGMNASPSDLRVGTDAELTINGKLQIEEGSHTFINNGTNTVNGILENQGIVKNDGQVDIYGTMNAGGTVNNAGTTHVYTGATLNGIGTWNGYAPVNMGGTINGFGLTQDQLEAALAEAKAGGYKFVLSQNFTLERDLTVDADFRVDDGISLTIPEGITLTLTEKNGLEVNGNLNNNGTVQIEGNVVVNGIGNNNGTVNVWYNGSVRGNGAWNGNEPVNQGGGSISGTAFAITEAEFLDGMAEAEAEGREYVLSMPVTLTGNLTINGRFTISTSGILTIAKNAELTISESAVVVNHGTMVIYGNANVDSVYTGEQTSEFSPWYGFTNNGHIDVYGKLTINGEMDNAKGHYGWYNGTNIRVHAGGHLHADGVWAGYAPVVDEGGKVTGTATFYTELRLLVEMNSCAEMGIPMVLNIPYTMIFDMAIAGDVTIGEGVTFTIPAGKTLTIPEGAKLTVKGNLVNNGSIVVEGTLNAEGYVTNNGSTTVTGTLNADGSWGGNRPSGTGTIGGTAFELNQDNLEQWLKDIENTESYYGLTRTFTLERDMTVRSTFFMEENGVLIIPEGKTLTIENGGTILVNVKGKLINNGTIVVKGNLGINGQLTNNGKVDVSGSLAVNDVYYANTKSEYINNGTTTILSGGVLDMEGIWTGNLPVNQGGTINGMLMTQADLEKAMAEVDSYTLDKTFELSEDLYIDGELVIAEGVTLTIPAGSSVWVNGNLINNGTIRVDGALRVINTMTNGETGTLEFNGSGIISGTVNNDGTANVYSDAVLSGRGDWNGNDPVNLGGTITGKAFEMHQEEFLELIANGEALTEIFTMEKSMTLDTHVTIGEGGRLVIPAGMTLTIAQGNRVRVEGGIITAETGARIRNYGVLENVHGTIDVQSVSGYTGSGGVINNYVNGAMGAINGIPVANQMIMAECRSMDFLQNLKGLLGSDISEYVNIQVELTGSSAVTYNMTIDENMLVSVMDGVSLNVVNNAMLTVNGRLGVTDSRLIVNGILNINGQGRLITWNGADIYVNGMMNNNAECELGYTGETGTLFNYGTVKNSGTMIIGGSCEVVNNNLLNNTGEIRLVGSITDNGTIKNTGNIGGDCGSKLTWNLSGGKLEITGQKAMDASPWNMLTSLLADITEVSMPRKLTSISDNAFAQLVNVAVFDVPHFAVDFGEDVFPEGATLKAEHESFIEDYVSENPGRGYVIEWIHEIQGNGICKFCDYTLHDAIEEAQTKEEVVDAFKNVDTEAMKEQIKQELEDLENGETNILQLIQKAEDKIISGDEDFIDAAVEAAKEAIAEHFEGKVTADNVIGAALSAMEGADKVTLVIGDPTGTPEMGADVAEDTTLVFNMTLDGVEDAKNLNAPVTIRLPIPENAIYENGKVVIWHFADGVNEAYEKILATVEDNMAVFTVGGFSHFAFPAASNVYVGNRGFATMAAALTAAAESEETIVVKHVPEDSEALIDAEVTIQVESGVSYEVKAAEGFYTVKNNDGTVSVKRNPVAKIGEAEYATMEDAIKAAEENAVITLVETIADEVVIGKPVTIMKNGKTAAIKADVGYMVEELTDSYKVYLAAAVMGEKSYATLADALNAAKTVEDPIITLQTVPEDGIVIGQAVSIKAPNIKYTIVCADGWEAVEEVGGIVRIQKIRGVQIGNDSYTTLEEALDKAEAGTTIKLLKDIEDEIIIGKPVTIQKNGHTANLKAAEGYILKESENAWTVVLAAASVGGKLYETLEEAVNAAEEEIIELLQDVGTVTIDRVATINTNGKQAEITAAEGFALKSEGRMIYVYEMGLFEFAGSNVATRDSLEMFFYVSKSKLSGTGYYAQIRRTYSDGKADEIVTIPYAQWEVYSSTLMRFGYSGIAAKEMADEFFITIYSSEGTAVSMEKVDSIQMYAERNMKDVATDKLTPVLVDMLNYGAQAQDDLNYNETDLANANIDYYQKYATAEVALNDYRVMGENYVGSTVSLKSNLMLSFYFKNTITRDTTAYVTYTDHYGNKEELIIDGSDYVASGKYFIVDVTGLAVADGRSVVSCEIRNGETVVASAVDSIESYAQRNPGVESARELMKFVDSAINYYKK